MQSPEDIEAEIALEESFHVWFNRSEEDRHRAMTLLSEFAKKSSKEDSDLLLAVCRIIKAINTLNHV